MLQAKMISAHMTLTPVVVGTLNTGTTRVARRSFFDVTGCYEVRDPLRGGSEPDPKSPSPEELMGGGVCRGALGSCSSESEVLDFWV